MAEYSTSIKGHHEDVIQLSNFNGACKWSAGTLWFAFATNAACYSLYMGEGYPLVLRLWAHIKQRPSFLHKSSCQRLHCHSSWKKDMPLHGRKPS